MKFRTPWQKKTAVKVERKVALGTSEALGNFLMYGSSSAGTPSAAMSLYEDSTAVSIPINMIADPFSVMEPILLVDNKKVDHDVIRLLNKPSPFYSREHFLEMLAKEYLITGETMFVAIGGQRRPPIELQPISVKNASASEGTGGTAVTFDISGNTLNGVYTQNV